MSTKINMLEVFNMPEQGIPVRYVEPGMQDQIKFKEIIRKLPDESEINGKTLKELFDDKSINELVKELCILNEFNNFVPENKDDVDSLGFSARMISENDLNKWKTFVKLMSDDFFTVCRAINEISNKAKYGSEVGDGNWGQKHLKHAIKILKKENVFDEERYEKTLDGVDSISAKVKASSFKAFFSWLFLQLTPDKYLTEEEKSLAKLWFSPYLEEVNKQKFKSHKGDIKKMASGFLESTKEAPDAEKIISKETQVKLETSVDRPISKVNEKRADIVDQNYKKLLEVLRKKQTKKEEKEK